MSTVNINTERLSRRPIGTGHCHILIARTAQELAGARYERLMGEDILWQEWKDMNPSLHGEALQHHFIVTYWGRYVAEARATLATMLTTNIAESLKEQITDALIKDASLRRGLRTAQR